MKMHFFISFTFLSAPFFQAGAVEGAIPAVPADFLVDSVGVNIHTHYQGTVYDQPSHLTGALQKLGVRHVRDGLADSSWTPYFDRLNDLGRSGIHSTLITSMAVERILPVASKLIDSIEAFEGPNEVNLNHWTPERARQYQMDLWTTIRADPTWAKRPIVCLSVTDYDYGIKLGDLSSYVDYGNLHPYPGGWEPENTAAWMKADLPTALAGGRKFSGEKPLVITETGYTTHQAKSGHAAVTTEMAGIYLPRMLLNTFANGIRRTYIYELFDMHDNAQDPEDNFGLVRSDGVTFKPAGIALSNLLALLRDPGPSFTPSSLAFKVSEATARTLLFQKRDGVFYLAVWLPSTLWDQSRPYGQKQQADPPDLPCAITLAKPAHSISRVTGLDGTMQTADLPAGTTITVIASERVTFVRIVP